MSQTEETGIALLMKEKPTLTQLVLLNMPTGTSVEEAQRVALKEISNYEMLMQVKPELKNCAPESVLLAVKQCISDGLTLAPSSNLVYLLPGKVKTGQNPKTGADEYKWVVNYDPTANGRLSIAFQSGSILDVKRPEFTYDEKTNRLKTVTVEFLVPSFPNPRWEAIIFGETHFKKWATACANKNNGKINANYTSWNGGIDPEFAGTKAIRHGLSKRGTNMNSKRGVVPAHATTIISDAAIKKEETELKDSHIEEATIISETKNTAQTNNEDNNDLPV